MHVLLLVADEHGDRGFGVGRIKDMPPNYPVSPERDALGLATLFQQLDLHPSHAINGVESDTGCNSPL